MMTRDGLPFPMVIGPLGAVTLGQRVPTNEFRNIILVLPQDAHVSASQPSGVRLEVIGEYRGPGALVQANLVPDQPILGGGIGQPKFLPATRRFIAFSVVTDLISWPAGTFLPGTVINFQGSLWEIIAENNINVLATGQGKVTITEPCPQLEGLALEVADALGRRFIDRFAPIYVRAVGEQVTLIWHVVNNHDTEATVRGDGLCYEPRTGRTENVIPAGPNVVLPPNSITPIAVLATMDRDCLRSNWRLRYWVEQVSGACPQQHVSGDFPAGYINLADLNPELL